MERASSLVKMNTETTLDFSSPLKNYEVGDTITCQILSRAPGGFFMTLPHNDIRNAFLPTSLKLEEGDLIEVFFVCFDGSKILLSLTDDEFRKHSQANKGMIDQSSSS